MSIAAQYRVADDSSAVEDVEVIFSDWLGRFGKAVETGDAATIGALFDEESYWKDILSLTSAYRTFQGRDAIEAHVADKIRTADMHQVRPAEGRAAPRHVRRAGEDVIEGYFDYETTVGRGTGFVRLLHDVKNPMSPRVWLLLTSLQELKGFEDEAGRRRPSGTKYSRNFAGDNWLDERKREVSFVDRDPQTIIVGGGQSGLILAARLRQMGVDALVVEKLPRVGDNWRNRYHSLTLHNEVWSNHLPYMPFPETWPRFLPKDMLALWLETYASAMELNVWSGTEFVGGDYDDNKGRWTVTLRQTDGSTKRMLTPHLVLATGAVSGVPHMPPIEGIEGFDGVVMHSGEYTDGAKYDGKHAIVIGTGNSGHDVAQDLFSNGAASVTMVQNGPTCVISLEPSATMAYGLYSEGLAVEDADLVNAAVPYPVQESVYRWMSTRMRDEIDSDLIAGLQEANFKTYYGEDDTGFLMLYFRRGGGYYINVGCSELIAEGHIGVVQASDIETFYEDGIVLKNSSTVRGDVIVMATGYKNQQEEIRRLLGDEVADKVGLVWGFDEHKMQRNVAQPTEQRGLWVMAGDLVYCRLYSRFLALQIRAALEGISMTPGSAPECANARG